MATALGERGLPLGMTTLAWLYQAPLAEVLQRMQDAGLASYELAAIEPHVGDVSDPAVRATIGRAAAKTTMTPISVNPTFVDINLVSADPLFRSASVERMRTHIELAAEIGAPRVVLMAGRRHALCPAPEHVCRDWLHEALDVLLPAAQGRGVVLCLENSPYGYMGRADDLMEVVLDRADPQLRITYDAANALAIEDAAASLRRVISQLEIAHVSDSWRTRWAHTSPGRGEVDFAGFGEALHSLEFAGPTIYELADGEPVDARLHVDLANLEGAGWDRGKLPQRAERAQ